MLSILIPTYNYNVYLLVCELNRQAAALTNTIEIIVLDDASDRCLLENEKIAQFENTQFIRLTKNIGRTAARQQLAEKALYETLLFLDADVYPKYDDFLERFSELFPISGLIFGGIAYESDIPEADKILRWKYGHARESLSVFERIKNKYESVNSGCFLLNKAHFLRLNGLMQRNVYGMDLLFKQLLKKYEIPVTHIDNPVFHLGLESNKQFVKKALEAVNTTVRLENSGMLMAGVRPIQKSYSKLKSWYLLSLFSLLISPFKKMMERNFNSSKPNLFWFDVYRLLYYIELKSKKSA